MCHTKKVVHRIYYGIKILLGQSLGNNNVAVFSEKIPIVVRKYRHFVCFGICYLFKLLYHSMVGHSQVGEASCCANFPS